MNRGVRILVVRTCDDCPHVRHRYAPALGGTRAFCEHPCTGERERVSMLVLPNAEPPAACPLRAAADLVALDCL